MATSRHIKDIAQALVSIAQEKNALVECIHDLKALQSVFRAEPGILADLSELAISLEQREKALRAGVSHDVHTFIMHTLLILQSERLLSDFSQFVETVLSIAQTSGLYQEATVTTTLALGKQDLQSLQKELERISGGNVEITERIDLSIVGGMLIEMGGKRIDGSVQSYCQQLQQALSMA